MSQTYYDIYIAKVKALAKTIVIKSATSALALNNAVAIEFGGSVNESDPTTWKYYMNLAGQYHATDEPMSVISLDTQQTIEFTIENLQIHLATAREYVYGSQYYKDLLVRYPHQEQLILGIINPIDINVAIDARDHQILWYDPTLVDDNETNLIPQLQAWIDGYMFRWNVSDYRLVDDLYPAAQLALMYLYLPITIINIRLANCHTRFANSYHIQEYLASNSNLDVYVPYLTVAQRLWLYRNIRYLQRNAGTQDTFDWLTQNILTPQKLPLADWTMRHHLVSMPDQLYPLVEYTRRPLNLGYNRAGVDIKSTLDLLDDEIDLAKDNGTVQGNAIALIEEQMQLSRFDRLKTKILESNTTDTTDASPYPLTDLLFNHWLWLASTGKYVAYITITNPATSEKYTLSVADAFVFFFYAYHAQYGNFLDTIPLFVASTVRRFPLPSMGEMAAMVDLNVVPTSVLEQALSFNPTIKTLLSTEGFHNAMLQQHAALLNQRLLFTQQPTYTGRSMAEAAIMRMYEDVPCDLGVGTRYEDWFLKHHIDLSTTSLAQMGEIARDIVIAATGSDLNASLTLANIQAAMLGIMRKLSSYAVQFVQIINSTSIRVADWAAPRLGEFTGDAGFTVNLHSAPIDVRKAHERIHESVAMDPTSMGLNYAIRPIPHYHMELDGNLDITTLSHVTYREHLPMPRINMRQRPSVVVDISGTLPGNTLNVYGPIDLQPISAALMYSTDTTYVPK